MLIDEQMPTWERRVLAARVVAAPVGATFAAIRRVDFLQSPVIALPNRARAGLDRLVRPSSQARPQPSRFGFDQLLEPDGGFHLLAEDPGLELVLGFIGRWWERGYGRVEWGPEDLRDYQRPGYAVGTWGFSVLPYGGRESVLVTDIRVRTTDAEARRRFRVYWAAVGPFVTAMGRPVLRLVDQEARREPQAGSAPGAPTTLGS
ncbi:MAG TPA: hypothetical protein VID94_18065 [Acidimicrobiales bacterium]